jgi:ABC-type uncharacterized transport system permease subunit
MPQANKTSMQWNQVFKKILEAFTRYSMMVLVVLLLFGIILLISGKDPIQSYRDILTSTFGSRYGFSEVIVTMTPMLITALAVALPTRIGLINVGGEGQLYMGACFATWGALTFDTLPAWALLPLMILLGMIGGGLWAFIPGFLKSLGLVNETITTLLLNSVAPSIVGFFVYGYWHSPMDTNKTANFVDAARRGLGFMGFLISWLSFGDPVGILVTSFIVSIVITGGNMLQLTSGIPYAVINILLAFALFVVLARPTFFKRIKV